MKRELTKRPCRVERNSKSPLLSLPPEIRNRIWEYTFGHNVYEVLAGHDRVRRPSIIRLSYGSSTGLALLQSCRQIYSEAALMPLHLSTFVFDSTSKIMRATSQFTKRQRKHIRHIRFDTTSQDFGGAAWFITSKMIKTAELFPSLKSIQIVVYDANSPWFQSTTFAVAEASIRRCLASLSQDLSVDVTAAGPNWPMF